MRAGARSAIMTGKTTSKRSASTATAAAARSTKPARRAKRSEESIHIEKGWMLYFLVYTLTRESSVPKSFGT